MIKIRMIQPLASVVGSYQPGQIIIVSEISPELDVLLTVPLADGTFRAEIVEEKAPSKRRAVETATLDGRERAVLSRGRGRVAS